jgi:hypothetical protein
MNTLRMTIVTTPHIESSSEQAASYIHHVCMYACMCVFKHEHMYVCKFMIYACLCNTNRQVLCTTSNFTRVCACVVYRCTQAWHIYVCVFIYSRKRGLDSVQSRQVCVCVCVFMYICMYVCMYIYIYIYIYIYMNINI